MDKLIIKADHLVKKFKNKTALDDLTFEISDVGIIGLIGRNGSGKTTLMKLCAGLLKDDGGELKVFGEEPMDNLSVLENIVYTYHDMDYYKPLKLKAILENYNTMFPMFDNDFALRLLKYFDLELKKKYIHLSEGEASLFNFICGLSSRAKLTMFDEPILGMDVAIRKVVYDVLLRDYNENPRMIMISSHMLSEICLLMRGNLCSMIILII